MIAPLSAILLGAATLTSAFPVERRAVDALNEEAFAQAHPRDDTATRAFSSTEIKTSSGQCLFVDELSGDFRANLTPIQVAECDGSAGQLWDMITSGQHNNVPGSMLIVSTLTQACFNFDPRRAAGNQVLLFSCGGRADGSGAVTNSQLFPFAGGAGPLALSPENAAGICLTVSGSVVDQAACNTADANQSFTFGDDAAPPAATTAAAPPPASTTAAAEEPPTECAADPPEETDVETVPEETTAVAITAEETAAATTAAETAAITTSSAAVATTSAAVATTSAAVATTSAAAVTTTTPPAQIVDANPTSAVPVSRAGGVLQPSAAAEANVRDDTATRAFTSVSLKSANGQCLFIDPTAGDFRENLIPIQLQECTGSANEKFDILTAGKHNDQPGSALIVSSLTQGCVNFDPRRAAGDTVIMFSCGGRANGEGLTTNSQLFPFTGSETSLALAPENANGATCLVPNGGLLDQAACSGDASQLFSIV